MGDDGEDIPPYVWTQTEPAEDSAPQTANYVKTHGRWEPLEAEGPCVIMFCDHFPCPFNSFPDRARVQYPNGDVFEGAFNELKQKHGRGVYTWGSTVGADHPWVPEEGFPGKQCTSQSYVYLVCAATYICALQRVRTRPL